MPSQQFAWFGEKMMALLARDPGLLQKEIPPATGYLKFRPYRSYWSVLWFNKGGNLDGTNHLIEYLSGGPNDRQRLYYPEIAFPDYQQRANQGGG